jgi:hypothetical protein
MFTGSIEEPGRVRTMEQRGEFIRCDKMETL